MVELAAPGSVATVSISRVNVGILGGGNVGGALVELIERDRAEIAKRTGIELVVTAVAVRSLSKQRPFEIDAALLTTAAAQIVEDPEVDLVVEVLGGIEPARSLISSALRHGKAVVTANKELLANVGHELFAISDETERDLLFEAAVAGGIPIIRPLRESLVGERISTVMGIVNGTTNYILTQMTDHSVSYRDALSQAQDLGFAERDPTADVEGYDAGAKAAIMASIAFGSKVVAGDVFHEGISNITLADIEYAAHMGYRIKLLAICERFDDDSVAVRVHPTMVPVAHPLASVAGSYNAVFIEGDAVGQLMFYGRGAGGYPTASAVLGDVIDAASNLGKGAHGSIGTFAPCRIRTIDEMQSAFYVNLVVSDEPGVLGSVAQIFGENAVSIRSMEQDPVDGGARLVFITHAASESSLRKTLKTLGALDTVASINSVLRVIES